MILKKWEDIPIKMQTEEVRKYYDLLKKKTISLFFKRLFDIIVSAIMLIVFSPIFLILAIAIKIDSPGSIFFRQIRVTQYGREFKIFKFRTMIQHAEQYGSQITSQNDTRLTRVGALLRKFRLDEIPQLINILNGEMSFVGTRPEVPKYVNYYTNEMLATLLLPAGLTSVCSIYYKDEAMLIHTSDNVEEIYVNKILPGKMFYNLNALKEYRFSKDIKVMLITFLAVLGKKMSDPMELNVHDQN